jgi:hypothetical protein
MGSHPHWSARALVWSLIVVVLLTLAAASAPAARHSRGACSSGASSVRAEKVNGRIVMSTPAVTGCIPG